LGAVQVWRNALQDQAASLANYRRALSLGGTKSLPELYQAAGAQFAFDAQTLREAVDLIEITIEQLQA
jgi:oligoendopeptidase F